MNKIEIKSERESTILILAINHYVTTSDYIGVGMSIQSPDSNEMQIVIPINEGIAPDVNGLHLLRARLLLIRPFLAAQGIPVRMEQMEVQWDGFRSFILVLPDTPVARRVLAGLLVTPFFPVEWGYTKPYVDKYCHAFPEIAAELTTADAEVTRHLKQRSALN